MADAYNNTDVKPVLDAPETIPLFRGVARETLQKALRGAAIVNLPVDSTLLQPGASNSSMYVVLAGELAAYLDPNNRDSAIPIIAGECVGELSALDGKPASALVLTRTPAKLLELPGTVFRNQVLTLPGVAANLLLALTARMRKANVAALKAQRDQIELQHVRKELEVARKLQLDMVPALRAPLFPQREDIDACAFMEPATKVGGALFDCCFVDREHLFFCIGKVSGQGMAAALSMSRVVSVLRKLAPEYTMNPASLLSDANARLCEGNEANVFVALFAAYLNVESGQLRYSNAGHCAPLLAWSGGSKRVPVPKGALLGAVVNMTYLSCDITLGPDDLLFCHTDGLTAASDDSQQEFGEQRVLELLAAAWHVPLPELLGDIHSQVCSFAANAKPDDDCAMFALRRSSVADAPALAAG